MASDQTTVGKVFIDSSVLIAAAISSKGSARDLIVDALQGKFTIVLSDLILEETVRNLSHKAPKALPALQLFLEALNPEVVSPSKSLVLKISKVVDVKDAPIVAGAVSAKAEYLASYDRRHLLQYKTDIVANFKAKVITPDEIVK